MWRRLTIGRITFFFLVGSVLTAVVSCVPGGQGDALMDALGKALDNVDPEGPDPLQEYNRRRSLVLPATYVFVCCLYLLLLLFVTVVSRLGRLMNCELRGNSVVMGETLRRRLRWRHPSGCFFFFFFFSFDMIWLLGCRLFRTGCGRAADHARPERDCHGGGFCPISCWRWCIVAVPGPQTGSSLCVGIHARYDVNAYDGSEYTYDEYGGCYDVAGNYWDADGAPDPVASLLMCCFVMYFAPIPRRIPLPTFRGLLPGRRRIRGLYRSRYKQTTMFFVCGWFACLSFLG